MPARHWSETYTCSCGKTFRSYAAEAFHRHNFPALCKPAKPKRRKAAPITPSEKKEARNG